MICVGARFRKDHDDRDPKNGENLKLYMWLSRMRTAKKNLEAGGATGRCFLKISTANVEVKPPPLLPCLEHSQSSPRSPVLPSASPRPA